MKKTAIFLLLLLCLPGFGGCGQKKENTKNQFQVYQVSSSETKVEAHAYEMQASDQEGMLAELIVCLSTVPEKLEYKAPFAMGFKLLNVRLEEGIVTLDVDQSYYNLEDTTEVLVRAAIVRTLTQLEGVSYVTITVEGNQLFDSVGEPVNLMNAEQFIDNDGNEINTYELVKVKLYFANESGDKLIAAYREKHYSTNIALERFVVEELIKGPSGQIEGLYPAVNPSTKIVNVTTKDGICYVNLDDSFLTAVNNVSTDTAIYAIVNSLVELAHINKVQILINGEVPSSFSTSVFERNLDDVITLEK